MNEHNNNDGQMEETMTDAKNPWNADLNDPYLGLKLASERLSIVRYVFLVQIEDGIASAAQRASLEYADAVLIGWPEVDAEDVVELDEEKLKSVDEQMRLMEQYIAKFSAMEREQDIDGMTDTLIRVTERVAEVRRAYQPDFPLPTFAEIRRVVQDEWDEDMGKIDPDNASPTADSIGRETADAIRNKKTRMPHDRPETHAARIRRSRFRTCHQLCGGTGTAHVRPFRGISRFRGGHRPTFSTRQLA